MVTVVREHVALPDFCERFFAAINSNTIRVFGKQKRIVVFLDEFQARESVEAEGRNDILDLGADQLALWQEAMRPVWEQFADDIGADRIAAASGSSSN